jgi:hypothetical protein
MLFVGVVGVTAAGVLGRERGSPKSPRDPGGEGTWGTVLGKWRLQGSVKLMIKHVLSHNQAARTRPQEPSHSTPLSSPLRRKHVSPKQRAPSCCAAA